MDSGSDFPIKQSNPCQFGNPPRWFNALTQLNHDLPFLQTPTAVEFGNN